MKGHEEDTCRFNLTTIQEAQRKAKQKAQQKPKATSSEAFAVEQAKISEFLNAANNIKEMPEMERYIVIHKHSIPYNNVSVI
jgi:hypothetical protein